MSHIVGSDVAIIYFDSDPCPPSVFVALKMNRLWVVMLSTDPCGAVVTSFPPSRGSRYFEAHQRLGRASEVMTWAIQDA